jgi:DNA modification methylase
MKPIVAKKPPLPNVRNRNIETRRVKASELLPNPKNPRIHGADQTSVLRGILEEVGLVGSFIGVETPQGVMLLDGHLRTETAGDAEVDVTIVDLSPAEQAKILASYDRVTGMAELDPEALDGLLREIETGDEDLAEMLNDMATEAGILEGEFGGLPGGAPEEDEAPDAPETPVTRVGDLWLCGPHRILCGDSGDAEAVKRLMSGERAGLYDVDAPYGVSYANDERPNPGVAKPRVANDTLEDAKLQEFLERAFRVAKEHALKPDAAWYLWHPMLTQGTFFAAAAAAAAVIIHRQIIWVKPVLLLGHGMYHWKHELCFMGWVEGNRPKDYGCGNGERTQTTVWEVASVSNADRKEFDHSTPKPVGLFTIPLIKHLRDGELCFDGFAGSFPQLIAAQQTGRRFFGMDVEPRFCDVGVLRYQNLTGSPATLDGDGRTFEAIKAERLG